MATGSWVVTATGVLAILAGLVVTVMGLGLVAVMFSGQGISVSSAGLVVLLSLVIGPLLTLAGPATIFAGIKLIGGHAWARTALEVFSWVALFAAIIYQVYDLSHQKEIFMDDAIKAGLVFLFAGGPSIIMLFLLRSDAVKRALTG